MSTSATASDLTTNIANFLPTGTFITFQAIAPLFTNNGSCGNVEHIMTGILLLTFSILCFLLTFTDSITTASGKVYYGIVTGSGLFNPQFNGSGIAGVVGSFYQGNPKYNVNIYDYIGAVLSVIVFDTLAILTAPVSTCYFPSIPNTVTKSVPILVGLVAVAYFGFAPPPRHGVGFAVTGPVTRVSDSTTTTTASTGTAASAQKELLVTPQEQAEKSAGISPV